MIGPSIPERSAKDKSGVSGTRWNSAEIRATTENARISAPFFHVPEILAVHYKKRFVVAVLCALCVLCGSKAVAVAVTKKR
jgi:hypothetical protein